MKLNRRAAGCTKVAFATAWVLQAVQPVWAQNPHRADPTPTSAAFVAPKRNLPPELPINIEIAWLGDPGLFSCNLVARISGEGLELTGFVASESLKRKAVEIAQTVAKTSVVDHLKVMPGMPIGALTGGRSTEIAPAATQMLSDSLGDRVIGLQVSSPEPGAIEIAGSVASAEDKLAVSKCLKTLRGCTHVINRADAPASSGASTVVKVIPKAVPPTTTTSTLRPFAPPVMPAEIVSTGPVVIFPRQNRNAPPKKQAPAVAHASVPDEAGPTLPVEAAPARRTVSAPETGPIMAKAADNDLMPPIREPLVAAPSGPIMAPPLEAPVVVVKPVEPTPMPVVPPPAPPAVAKAPRVEIRPVQPVEPAPVKPKIEGPVELVLIPAAPPIPVMPVPEPVKPAPAEPIQTVVATEAPKVETPKVEAPIVETPKPAPIEVVKAPPPSVEIPLPAQTPMMPEMPKAAAPAEPKAVLSEPLGFAETQRPASGAKMTTVEAVKATPKAEPVIAEMPKPIEPVVAAPMPAPEVMAPVAATPIEVPKPAIEMVKTPDVAPPMPARNAKTERFTMTTKAPEPKAAKPVEPKPLPSLEPTVKFGGERATEKESTTGGKPIMGMVRVPSRGATADMYRARAAMDDLCRGQCRDMVINASAERLAVQMKIGAAGDWEGLLSKLKSAPELAGYAIVYNVTVDGQRVEPAIRSVAATSSAESAAPNAPMMGVMRLPAGSDSLPDADAVRKAVEETCRGAGEEMSVRATGARQIAVSMKVRQASDWNRVHARIKQLREVAGYSVVFNVQIKG